MPLKLVTFDLAEPDAPAQLPQLIRSLGETTRLSATTFVVDTPLSTDQVLAKLMKAVGLDDDVYVLTLSPWWSGYGEMAVTQFLKGRTRDS